MAYLFPFTLCAAEFIKKLDGTTPEPVRMIRAKHELTRTHQGIAPLQRFWPVCDGIHVELLEEPTWLFHHSRSTRRFQHPVESGHKVRYRGADVRNDNVGCRVLCQHTGQRQTHCRQGVIYHEGEHRHRYEIHEVVLI